MKIAFLFHLIKWDSKSKQIELSNNVKLCCFENSDMQKIYFKLCYDYGYDFAEPFDYGAYALFDGEELIGHHNKESLSPISLLSSAITLCTKEHLGMCRSIASNDNFMTVAWTEMVYEYTAQTSDFLGNNDWSLTDEHLIDIEACYKSLCKLMQIKHMESPLIFAISFYYDAWSSQHLEQCCVNLSILLEALFSPVSNTDLSHQIAYNFCWFAGTDNEHRKELYEFCKKFYSLRSKIIHGTNPNQDILIEIVPKMFYYCSDIMKRILLDNGLLEIFEDKNKKENYFKDKLFNHNNY